MGVGAEGGVVLLCCCCTKHLATPSPHTSQPPTPTHPPHLPTHPQKLLINPPHLPTPPQKLLINPSWLETKLHAYGAASVVADFRRYLMAKQDTELKLVLEAFQMAASSSSQCPMAGMLAMQMAGRLMSVTTSAMIKVGGGGVGGGGVGSLGE